MKFPVRSAALSTFFTFFLFFGSIFPCFAAEKLKLRVGAYDNPPKIRVDNSGKVSGFWPELLANIAALEGWELEYVKSDWSTLLNMLLAGDIDIMPDVAFTPQRAGLYSFNKIPVIVSWSRVYVRSDNESILSLEDLQGKKIAGLYASVNLDGPDGIKRMVQSFNLKSTIVELDSYDNVFKALEDGFADAAITNRNFGDEYIKSHPVKKTAIMLQPVSLLFAFPKDIELTEKLSSRIDRTLRRMTNDSDSVYYQLLSKYFETEIAEKKIKETPHWVAPLFTGAVIVALCLFGMNIYTRKQVRLRTAELQKLNSTLKEKIASETARRLEKEQIIYEQKKFADMGQMMGAISHQWRQPLNNIYLIAQLMQEQWQDGQRFSDSHSESFARMTGEINKLSSTIDNFRSFFAPYKEKTDFNVSKTVMECLRLINSELIFNKINIYFRCECPDKVCEMSDYPALSTCDNSGIYIRGHEGELKQIVLNLLTNAKDAIRDTEPSYKKISVTVTPADSYVTITVEDTGGGIDKDSLGRIFDPYFTTKPEGEGIGIGLYMAKTVLKNHMDGDISAENTGYGAKITVRVKKATD